MSTSKKTLSVTKTIRRNPILFSKKVKHLCFRVKNAILGKNYTLSIVFVGEKRSQTLNREYRGKDKPTDILSFPLSKNEGEIFIDPKRTKIEARKFGRSPENFLLFLLIHGFCHLKGMTHSSKMESIERKFRNRFKV